MILVRPFVQAGQIEAQVQQRAIRNTVAARFQHVSAFQQFDFQRPPIRRRQMHVAGAQKLVVFGHGRDSLCWGWLGPANCKPAPCAFWQAEESGSAYA